MAAAVKPGGIIVVEDAHFDAVFTGNLWERGKKLGSVSSVPCRSVGKSRGHSGWSFSSQVKVEAKLRLSPTCPQASTTRGSCPHLAPEVQPPWTCWRIPQVEVWEFWRRVRDVRPQTRRTPLAGRRTLSGLHWSPLYQPEIGLRFCMRMTVQNRAMGLEPAVQACAPPPRPCSVRASKGVEHPSTASSKLLEHAREPDLWG